MPTHLSQQKRCVLTKRSLPIIDSHVHYFAPDPGKHQWLIQPSETENFLGNIDSLRQTYLPTDYLHDSAAFLVEKIVYVQAGWDCKAKVEAETEWLISMNDPRLGAIVAYVNLTDPHLKEKLRRLARYPLVKGIRQIIAWHKDPYYRSCDEDFLNNLIWRKNFSLLSQHNFSFDLQIFPEQTDDVVDLLKDNLTVPVVIEHLLQPRSHQKAMLAEWKTQLEKLASLPHVYIKLSGAHLFIHDAKKEDVEVMIKTAIDFFGPKRCMFGSNFPVEKLYISYDQLLHQFWSATEANGDEAQAAIFNGTAKNFYRI